MIYSEWGEWSKESLLTGQHSEPVQPDYKQTNKQTHLNAESIKSLFSLQTQPKIGLINVKAIFLYSEISQ